MERRASVPALTDALRGVGYLADRGLATTLHVALELGRPVLLEGEVGVGKTEVARALSEVLDRKLIRLQCYEGIDAQQALYEWDYARQMLQIRALSEHQLTDEDSVDALFAFSNLVIVHPRTSGPYPSNVVLIAFRRGATRAQKRRAIDAVGGTLIGGNRAYYFVRVDGKCADRPVWCAIDRLEKLPQVEESHPYLYGGGTNDIIIPVPPPAG